ncbi:GNAT family N-acetyltransferase [Brachybacterium sp. UMB0905]|uniref:GNAT family N-acetyltransferase n=1 Tax=Brachybacterium sp. UMB0905 TaxID=2069310 RepID=UPI000C801D42|nr:GNAT family N-acetyltransferase [Brachybacterium sp. UMB0905]PMC76337.1 GNAT family N-acetyltransferase [Brachybacterium sp. UMB0905]
MTELRIRPARLAEIPRVVEIETQADQVFRTVGLPELAQDPPDPGRREALAREGRLWVLERVTTLAGFVTAELLDGHAHVGQLSVAPEHAGHRLGRRLLEHVEHWGRAQGCPATTLTTFVDVPWNAPYYTRLGYAVLPAEQWGPGLTRTMQREAGLPGLGAAPRCAMIKPCPSADGA